MESPQPGPVVSAGGASCRLGPSPTAQAIRLTGLRVTRGDDLDALLEKLPEPPWDVELASDDPAVGLLSDRGFERYMGGVFMAREAAGVRADPPPDIEFADYRNDWAQAFSDLEARAMAGLAAFAEMGSPSGYEWGAGHGVFVAALDAKRRLVGFAHAEMPDGMIDWLAVDPDRQREGIGSGLVRELGRRVVDGRGTHLMAVADEDSPGPAFLRSLGFRDRGHRVSLIRRSAG